MKKLLLLFSLGLCACNINLVYDNVNYSFNKEEGVYEIDYNKDSKVDFRTINVIYQPRVDRNLLSTYYVEKDLLVIYIVW